MSGASEYCLRLSPFYVHVSVDLEAGNVDYSGVEGGPNRTGPSFVDSLPATLVKSLVTHQEALQRVCYDIEHMLDVEVDYDNISKHLVEGSLDDCDGGKVKCPGCNGKGKYVGAWEVEDPCKQCNGEGLV